MLLPEIENVAFSLKAGEISGIVKTQTGYHVLQVVEKILPKPADFKQAKENLKGALLQQKISQVFPIYLQELRAKAKIEPNL